MNRSDLYQTGPFDQRTAIAFPLDTTVRSLAAAPDGTVIAATDAGLYRLGEGVCSRLGGKRAFSRVIAFDGVCYAAAGSVLYTVGKTRAEKVFDAGCPIDDLAADDALYLLAGNVVYRRQGAAFVRLSESDQTVHLLAVGGGRLCAAGERCLSRMEGKRRTWRNILPDHSTMPELHINALAFDGVGYLWVGADEGAYLYDYKDGWVGHDKIACLPAEKVYAITTCGDGSMLLGTDAGAVHIQSGAAKYLPATRYAAATDVRAVAESGGTLYTGAEGGAVAVRTRRMTLEEKEEILFDMTEAYFPRKDGFVVRIHGLGPDGLHPGVCCNPSDNDGLHTQTYLTALALRWARTGDKRALAAARRSMKAMLLLMRVSGVKGFPARAVRYPDEPDWGVNLGSDKPGAEWHRTADGKTEWLGETSSDEVTGHYLGFSVYYDLCATAAEKKQIRTAVCDLTDHILDHGGYLHDIDGKPTSWACWAPEALNHDSMWMWEKGVNSLEMLAYLKVAHHVSGDAKYDERYRSLIRDHHFLLNAAYHKRADGHACHIDDNLALLAAYTLLRLEDDPAVRAYLLMGLTAHFEYERREHSPGLCFLYGACTGRPCDVDEAVQTLRDFPLDLVQRTMVNRNRKGLAMDDEPLYWGEEPHLLYPLAWDERPLRRNDPFAFEGGHASSAIPATEYLFFYELGRALGVIG